MSTECSLADLTADNFRGAQGSSFEVSATAPPRQGGEPSSFQAQLAEVTERPDRVAGSFRAPFSVVFHGPLEPVMPQGTYRLVHDQLGTLDLFLVPIGPDTLTHSGGEPTAMRYEAVFG